MTFSYTQISQYLRCPRSYRYRYLDGWQEKDTRAAMVFGRCFEVALGAYFRREDPGATLFKEWSAYRDTSFEYRKGDSWDRLLHQGIHLLQRFAQDDRVQIVKPTENLQVKLLTSLSSDNEFVAYIDAFGKVDGQKCLIDWKTTTSSYPEGPSGLLALDPQLICYSWITGISDVALVVFVRKADPEIQYLKTSITDHQRQEFGELARTVISQIERGEFLAHSGIRFPSNGCTSCAHLGLCLQQQDLIDTHSSAAQELLSLIGLNSFRISGEPLVEPQLNERRAIFVLGKIEEILSWEKITLQEKDTRFVELGKYLCEVRSGQYWRMDNLKSFDEFLEKKFPESRRKAYYLMAVHEHLTPVPKAQLEKLGWTKARELAKLARAEGPNFDCAPWVHKAATMPREEFRREVERHLTGRETEPWDMLYFKVYKSQLPVIEQALETAGLMLGNDRARGYCLEMICADFLAGARLEDDTSEAALTALIRLFGLLTEGQKTEFTDQIKNGS